MYSIARIEELIGVSENTLQKYQTEYLENPTSLFAKGMIKNTTERLEELRGNLAFEKRLREKEVIDLRLKGKLAQMGRLPLELLGHFAKQLSDVLTEAGRQYQFGNKTGTKYNELVRKSINLEFERLVPGSTRILITGSTNPDLFGNSILENSLTNTFNVLSSNPQKVLEASEKIGAGGIKKIGEILTTAYKNDMEFDLEWTAPNEKPNKWVANMDTIQALSNTISKIHIVEPLTIDFKAKIIMESLKGVLEVEDLDESKKYKIVFPLEMIDKVKLHRIGDTCNFSILQKTIKNLVTGEEKNSFQLIDLH